MRPGRLEGRPETPALAQPRPRQPACGGPETPNLSPHLPDHRGPGAPESLLWSLEAPDLEVQEGLNTSWVFKGLNTFQAAGWPGSQLAPGAQGWHSSLPETVQSQQEGATSGEKAKVDVSSSFQLFALFPTDSDLRGPSIAWGF